MNEPHWLTIAIFSAILGVALPPFLKLLGYLVRSLRPHLLKRTWYLYHISMISGDSQLFESVCEIRTGLRSRLCFQIKQTRTDLVYRGKVILESDAGQFVLLGKASEHGEHTLWRFVLPLKSKSTRIVGIHASYNHDKRPYCSAALLSAGPIDQENAMELMRKGSMWTQDVPMLTIKD